MTTHEHEHPLLAAVEAGDAIGVTEELTHEVDADTLATALAIAAMQGATDLIDRLLDAGADVDEVDGGGDAPLFLAAMNGKTETVKALLSHGADPDVPNEDEVWTPLMVASRNGDEPTVRLLLNAGADTGFTNGEGDTALNLAAGNGRKEIVALLLPMADEGAKEEAEGLLADFDEMGA